MARRLTLTLIVVVLSSLAMITGALSAFTSTASDSGSVQAGNIGIQLGSSAATGELTYDDVGCTVDAMAPGDDCVDDITITNIGTLDLTYTVEALDLASPSGCFLITFDPLVDTNNAGGTTAGVMPAACGADVSKSFGSSSGNRWIHCSTNSSPTRTPNRLSISPVLPVRPN